MSGRRSGGAELWAELWMAVEDKGLSRGVTAFVKELSPDEARAWARPFALAAAKRHLAELAEARETDGAE